MNDKTQTKNKWVSTDPDSEQFGRQITKTIFEFKQKDVPPTIVDLSDYEGKEIEHIINAYGYSQMGGQNLTKGLKNIVELYGKNSNWIIAECIFESEII